MKKLLFLITISFVAVSVTAQLKIDLMLSATPPATLTEWGNRREVLTMVVTGQPGLSLQFKIKAKIETTDGTVIGTTDLARAATFSISSASLILTANDVIPLENMVFTGKYKSSLERSGKLPSDNYMLCVQLVKPVDYTAVSQELCKNFYLAATQLPILMKPYDKEVLDAQIAQTAITFRWTPALPRTTSLITYRLQVFEILDKQSPMQALRSNQPLLDQQVTGTTQYIWRPQMSFMFCCKDGDVTGDEKNINTSEDNLGAGHNKTKTIKPGQDSASQKNINTSEDNLGSGHNRMFIWTIQTLDDHGLPVTQTDGSGEARSEPIIFSVKDNSKMKVKERGNR
jgi:hypothetical protein